ncbi:outer membrane protein [Kaistia terrae]|uniref:Outer membrane protein n=1 Tax=Kaistia terrae TaxID=537017 RepID=A0ABW0Q0D4_9HYPH|nr:outer membrane protein [Kaistia terrae]MCX5578712.1 porin family protein [Kaistia terrae]
MTASKFALLATTLLVASPALAADLTYEPAAAPVAAAAPFSWTGFYIGLNAGYGWGDIDTTENSMTTNGRLVGIGQGNLGQFITFPGADSSSSVDGILGGAQIGYNYQIDNWVLGAEADYQAADLKTSSSFLGSVQGPYYQTSAELQSFGTVRARVGYAIDNVLIYGTGGLAVGQAKAGLSVQGGVPGAFTGPEYAQSNSKTMVGYAIGAGAEWAIAHSNWSVKAEYLYTDFGSKTFDFDFGAGDKASSRGDVSASIVRAGLNYRF